jgi:uncharacterized Zn finger protein (UPF0148 family)
MMDRLDALICEHRQKLFSTGRRCPYCGALLSRYNSGRVCAACHRQGKNEKASKRRFAR